MSAIMTFGETLKWVMVGIIAVFVMMFVAFPIGVGLIFLWEAFVDAFTAATA